MPALQEKRQYVYWKELELISRNREPMNERE